jgi:hypothetical protein
VSSLRSAISMRAIADPTVHGTLDNDSKTSDPGPVIALAADVP